MAQVRGKTHGSKQIASSRGSNVSPILLVDNDEPEAGHAHLVATTSVPLADILRRHYCGLAWGGEDSLPHRPQSCTRSLPHQEGWPALSSSWLETSQSHRQLQTQMWPVQEGLILDDPTMDKIEAADLKSWLTSEEDQNCSGRYNDVKLARNGLRALGSNDIAEVDEPLPDRLSTTITTEEFTKLAHKLFAGYKEADIQAILKRSIVFVFGKHAVYLRLPNNDMAAPIHRILMDNIHADLFSDRDKPFYAKYKTGIEELPPTFEEDVHCEQSLILHGITELALAGNPSTYIDNVNTKLAQKLQDISRGTNTRWVPGSPSSEEDDSARYSGPVVPHAAPPLGARLGTLVYPSPARRVRIKSAVVPSESSCAEPSEVAKAASSVKQDHAEKSLSGEEEAACAMHA